MPPELLLALKCSDERAQENSAKHLKPRDCVRCERPKSVCLCPSLPSTLLPLAGRVIVLQHPQEHKKRLATVPVLLKCVAGAEVLRGRVYKPGQAQHAALGAALAGAAEGRYPLLVLFPGAGARDVREVGAELLSSSSGSSCNASGSGGEGSSSGSGAAASQPPGQQAQAQQAQEQQAPEQAQEQQAQEQAPGQQAPGQQAPGQQAPAQQPPAQHDPLYVLFVIDGTWKQAKEMFKAVLPFVLPPGGPGVRVQLPPPVATPCGQQAQQAQADEPRQTQQPEQAQQQQQQRQDGAQQRQAQACVVEAGQRQDDGPLPAAEVAGTPSDGWGPLLLRMEPMEGCLTTCEAVARALGALEPAGDAVRDAILRPLAQLAHFQAQFDPAVAHRLQQGAGYSQRRCRMGMGRLGKLEDIP